MTKKKFDRKQLKADTSKRGVASYTNREDSGRFRDYLDPEKMEHIDKWWASKAEHLIDIIPYRAGAYDPQVPEGRGTYLLDIWVHPKIGPSEDTFVCPVQYGKSCPICNERKRRNDADEDYDTRIKVLNTSRRVLYNVIVRDGGKEERKGVQVFEIAHWFMEKNLIKIAKNPRGGMDEFWDADTGKTVVFERTGTGAKNTQYDGHRLIERVNRITDEELLAAYCLDELLIIPSEETLSNAFFGTAAEQTQDDSVPESEQDQNDVNETPEATEIPETPEPDPDPDPDPDSEQSASPKPKPKPKPKAKQKAEELVCPIGMEFANQWDEWEQCDTCAIRDQCKEASEVPF